MQVSGKLLFGTFETPVSGGLYAATKGKYRVVYAFHEHATLLDGQLALTDETTGKTVIYGPGDSWIIAKGTPVIWDIRSPLSAKAIWRRCLTFDNAKEVLPAECRRKLAVA